MSGATIGEQAYPRDDGCVECGSFTGHAGSCSHGRVRSFRGSREACRDWLRLHGLSDEVPNHGFVGEGTIGAVYFEPGEDGHNWRASFWPSTLGRSA